jgi:outer membrane lipoprotein-sorting protein
MKPLLKKALLVFLASSPCAVNHPTIAETLSPTAAMGAPSADQQKNQIQKLQDYLNGITTLRANFFQENADGTTCSGKIYVNRSGTGSFGKLRLEYAPPMRVKIIANGEILRHEDEETKDVNDYSIDSTPASFLLRHRIDFFNDLEVKRIESAAGKIALTVMRPGDDGVTLTLVFVTSPMLRLQEWTVIDPQSNKTHVILTNVEIGVPLDKALFMF